jgi:suppressor for copper-sensitivity B
MEKFLSRLREWLFIVVVFSTSLCFAEKSPIDIKLLSGGHDGKQVSAGLLLSIPSPWHVYGPTPSNEEAAGFSPTLSWETSSNLQDAEILWPTPRKTNVQDQLSYIYEGKAFIPLNLHPQNLNVPITLNLKVSLLACAETCVPVEENLSLVIQPADKADPLYNEMLVEEEEENEAIPLVTLLAIALLGGFILNFMPCVLPVLSLKVMSLIKQSKKNHMDHAKTDFFITGLGILFSFLLLALLTIILKESGEAFGWGIHFQNPHFLLFVFLVLIAFSASLWGVFEIDLPSGLGTWLITHEGKGKVKDFLSGMFATLLATPCSAPFVGTALSFALARNTEDIFLVFLFLGLGFASPYFLVAGLPSRFIRLPKPGLWMVWVQKVLGIILALTALWIGWILSFHMPLWALGLSIILSLIALSLFWIKHHKKPALRVWAFAMPLFLTAWGLSWIIPHEHHPVPQKIVDYWKPFDPQAIPDLVKQGKTVFVDATAEWCVTCAVNKKLVLNSAEIETLLTQPHVIAMRADWTKQDPQVTDFLQKHDRYGIPFNVVYGPQSPEGIALPEILSVSLVQEAFKKAGG